MPYHVSKAEFADLVEKALSELPAAFTKVLDEVPVEIRDRASSHQLRQLGLRDDQLLLGLYHGRPLPQRSVEDSGRLPDAITIFQQAIEQVVNTQEQLMAQVRTTVLHEIGHYFGMTEADLEHLGYG